MKTPKIRSSIGVLSGFRVVRPRYEIEQTWAFSWLAQAHARSDAARLGREAADPEVVARSEKLFTRFGCSPDKIRARGTEVKDTTHSDFNEMGLFSIGPKRVQAAGMRERMDFYSKRAGEAMSELYAAGTPAPAHLIYVTCTGYVSPSPAQALVDERGWHGQTAVTHAYHMGCYAALPAVRMAEGLLASSGEAIDIVHNELCTLHFDPSSHAPEQMVVQSLFSDGHIRYSLSAAAGFSGDGLELHAIHELLIPGTRDQMSWVPTEAGMQMTLSKDVPRSIAEQLPGFLACLLEGSGLTPGEARKSAIFAVHPGGPRIIDSVRALLELSEAQVAHSQGVLRDYGNMSSATLPHVWQRLLDDPAIEPGRFIVSLAFGPGLTIFGALLRKR